MGIFFPKLKESQLERTESSAVIERVEPIIGELVRADGGRRDPRRRAVASYDQVKSYAAAKSSEINAGWTRTPTAADADIQRALSVLRARSRTEYQSNDYAKRAVGIYKENVVGCDGIRMQARALDSNGELDKDANKAIEKEHKLFMRRGVPDVTGKLSGIDCYNQAVQSMVVDGEVLAIAQRNWKGNKYGFAIQFVDPQLLDIDLNDELSNGNIIRMGVELNEWKRPVAYWFIETNERGRGHVDDYYHTNTRKHKRVPAESVFHGYWPEFVAQTRGVPLLAVSLVRSNMLRGYEGAELVAAREAAENLGFVIEAEDGAEAFNNEDEEAMVSGSTGGTKIDEIEYPQGGQLNRLPHGTSVEKWSSDHPKPHYPDYTRAIQRGIAAGSGLMYPHMTGDLESVNFSSLRAGNLWEQDTFKCAQRLIIEGFCTWAHEKWLGNALLNGAVITATGRRLKPRDLSRYLDCRWQPKRWPHVQPKEQAAAERTDLENGTTTRSAIIRSRGEDPDEVFDEQAEELEKMAARKLPDYIAAKLNANNANPDEPEPDDEPEPEPDDGDESDSDGDSQTAA